MLHDQTPMRETDEDRAVRDGAYRVTAAELRQFVERYERLESEKRDIADQMKEVMAEARARGYDTKVLRKLIALRKRDASEVSEEEAILELYKEALGMAEGSSERSTAAGQTDLVERIADHIAREAVPGTVGPLGRAVELTDEERAKGVKAAFIGKDGTRSTISHG